MSNKKDVFGVITKKTLKSLEKKFQNNGSVVRSSRSNREVLKLLQELGKFIKEEKGSIEEFCFKSGISPRQMREYRAKYRSNPSSFND